MIYSITLRSICFSLCVLSTHSLINASQPTGNALSIPTLSKTIRKSEGITGIASIARAYKKYGCSARENLPKTYQALHVHVPPRLADNVTPTIIQTSQEQKLTTPETAKIYAPRPIKPVKPELFAIINCPQKSPQ